MINTSYLTTKQIAILSVISAGNPNGSAVDLDELLDRLEYETTKQSMHFSLRALIARGLITKSGREKRRGRCRVLIELSAAGLEMFPKTKAGLSGPSLVASVETDEAESLLSE